MKSYKTLFFVAVFCTLSLAVLGPLRPMLIGEMVNKYIVQGQDGELLLFWSGIVAAMLLGEAALQFANSYFSNCTAPTTKIT